MMMEVEKVKKNMMKGEGKKQRRKRRRRGENVTKLLQFF
jgi:hypothetical protein